jgi:dTDP-4-amino-4,6-dideoxygalactose transaminase
MFNNGIQVNVNNRRNDRYTLFGGQCNNCDCKVECEKNNLPITNKCDQDVILLPCHGDLSNNDVTKIIETIKKFDEL